MSTEPTPPSETPARPASARKRSWVKISFAILGILLLLFVVVIIGGYLAFQNYLHSDDFRVMIERETNDALDAKGEYAPLNWAGTNVYSPTYRAIGLPDALFTRLQADGVRAYLDLNAAWDGIWRVERLEVNHALIDLTPPGELAEGAPVTGDPSLNIGLPVPATEALPEPPEVGIEPAPVPDDVDAAELNDDDPAPATAEGDGGGLFESWIPDQFQLEEIAIASANLVWAPGEGKEGKLTDTSLIVRPDDDMRAWEIFANGGALTQENWPEVTVQEMSLRVDEDRVHVLNTRLEGPEAGRVTTSGEVLLKPATAANLRTTLAAVPLRLVLPEDWQERLSGRLNGDVHLQGDPTETETLRIEGDLNIDQGVVQGVPVLDTIAKYSRTERFKLLQLDEARTDFTFQDNLLTFKNLVMEDQGLLKVLGSGTVSMPAPDDEDAQPQVKATFEVGVAPGTLRWLLGAEERVFVESRDGYKWTTMTVTGPLDKPEEDLSPRLKEAFSDEIVDKVEGIIDDVPDDVKEQGQDLIDTARDVLKGLFR